MAWTHLNDGPYYQCIVEMNWPGVVLIHEIGMRLFGVHFWTFHLIDFWIMQTGAIYIFLFLRYAGFLLAPFIALAIYPIIYTTAGEWMAGQRDIIGVEFLIVALVPLISSSNSVAGIIQSALAGSLIAFAVLIRPTYASFIVGVLLLNIFGSQNLKSLRLPRIQHAWSVLGGFIALIGCMLIAGWLIGNLSDWYEQAILFPLQSYPSNSIKIDVFFSLIYLLSKSWHWMTLLAGFGLLTWFLRHGLRLELILVVGVGLTIILSYFVQGKTFDYHLGGLIPLFILLTAVLIDELLVIFIEVKSPKRRWVYGMLASLTILLTVFGTTKKLTAFSPQLHALAEGEFQPVRAYYSLNYLDADEIERLVNLIQAGSGPNALFFQWERYFVIGYLSQRRPSTRFINTPVFASTSASFDKEHHWSAEFRRDLLAEPPSFILIKRSSLGSLEPPFVSLTGASADFQFLLDDINNNYRAVAVSKKVILFKRK